MIGNMILFDGTKTIGLNSFLVFVQGDKRVEIPVDNSYKKLFLQYLSLLGKDTQKNAE
jgi:hypothetical protein